MTTQPPKGLMSKEQIEWVTERIKYAPLVTKDISHLLDHIAALTEKHRLVSEECRAWRELRGYVDVRPENFIVRDRINAARSATDAARALGGE